jgi:hypothetical protein
MHIIRKSPFTGEENSMDLDVTWAQLYAWKAGGLIQDVFPNLTADEREFIMTGITPADWARAFDSCTE